MLRESPVRALTCRMRRSAVAPCWMVGFRLPGDLMEWIVFDGNGQRLGSAPQLITEKWDSGDQLTLSFTAFRTSAKFRITRAL